MKKKKKKVRVTLATVISQAAQDGDFLNALMENPVKALNDVGWTLSAADMRKLREIIRFHRSLKRKKGAESLWLTSMTRGGPVTWPKD